MPPTDQVDAFLDALVTAIEDPTGPIRLLATLRADFYDRPLSHPRLAPLVKETVVEVTPMAAEELENAVTSPARAAGLTLAPGLTARIVSETAGETAPLPLLQYALWELTEQADSGQLTMEDFEALGGIGGALVSTAERTYQQADTAVQHAMRRVLGRLVDVQSGGR